MGTQKSLHTTKLVCQYLQPGMISSATNYFQLIKIYSYFYNLEYLFKKPISFANMSEKEKETSLELRMLIAKYHNDGKSLREIGELVGRSKATIQTIIRNYKETNCLESKARSGRPPKVTSRIKRQILGEIKKKPRNTAVEIAKHLETNDIVKIHPETVRSVLRNFGFHSRVPRKKPYISDINKTKRIEFANAYYEKKNSFWANTLFSDESKFNLFGSDGRQKVWRKKNDELSQKNLLPTVKHGGGNVMVWGCMSAAGVGNLVFIETTMDRIVYLNLLKGNLKQSAEKLGLNTGWYFQQDNDPKHTAGVVREWLLYNVPHQLHSPPQSPDLNPIEHLWDELGRSIQKKEYKK